MSKEKKVDVYPKKTVDVEEKGDRESPTAANFKD